MRALLVVALLGSSVAAETGSGYGRAGRADPLVKLGEPAVTGELEVKLVRRYVKRHIQRLSFCYEQQLQRKPKLAGKLVATFEIDAEGKVASSEAKGVDPEVEACVARSISMIQFPKPKRGTVAVSFPLTFAPPRR